MNSTENHLSLLDRDNNTNALFLKQTHSVGLVDSTFLPEQAREILCELINSKIRFHNREILSCWERNKKDAFHSERRIAELCEALVQISELTAAGESNGKKLHVHCNIDIRFV